MATTPRLAWVLDLSAPIDKLTGTGESSHVFRFYIRLSGTEQAAVSRIGDDGGLHKFSPHYLALEDGKQEARFALSLQVSRLYIMRYPIRSWTSNPRPCSVSVNVPSKVWLSLVRVPDSNRNS